MFVSALVPLNAEEHRTVTMEVLAVKETEVCPSGYGRPCGDVNVLDRLAELRRERYSRKYELNLRPQNEGVQQDAVEPVRLELSPGMMRTLGVNLESEPALEERYAGLFVFHMGDEFQSIVFRRHGGGKPRGGRVDGYRRWYDHHGAMYLMPINTVTWTVQLDESTVNFEFIAQQRKD